MLRIEPAEHVVTVRGSVLHVELKGRVGALEQESLGECSHILEAAARDPVRIVVIDLGSVVTYGAALLGIIARFQKILRQQHRTLVVVGDMLGLMALCKLDRRIPTFADYETAFRNAFRFTQKG